MPAEPGSFEFVVVSLRRWVLGLGIAVLAGMVLLDQPRDVLAGFCVGWLLALFTLDHIAGNARRLMAQPHDPAQAQERAVRTYMQRWAIVVGSLAVAHKLGANLVAAVMALLLLQAAIMCRSIAVLVTRADLAPVPEEPPPAGNQED